jgi:hypothetical protein
VAILCFDGGSGWISGGGGGFGFLAAAAARSIAIFGGGSC